VIYPFREKTEIIKFNEVEIINLFLKILDSQISDLKENIEIAKGIMFDDFCQLKIAAKFCRGNLWTLLG